MRRTFAILTLLIATLFALSGTAHAQAPYGPGDETLGEVIERVPPSDGAQVLPLQVERTPDQTAATGTGQGGQSLPVTGGDVVALAAMGAGAVVIGAGLMRYRRRAEG